MNETETTETKIQTTPDRKKPLYETTKLWAAFGIAQSNPLSALSSKAGIADTAGRSHVTVNDVFNGTCANLNCVTDVALALGFSVQLTFVPLETTETK